MNNGEVDVGSLVVSRLILMTRENKIVWVFFRSEYHSLYRDITFKIVPENGLVLCVSSALYNVSRVTDVRLPDLVNLIKEQDINLSSEKRTKVLSSMLGRGHLYTVLEILSGQ